MIKVIAFDYADVIAPSPVAKWLRENMTPNHKMYLYYQKHSKGWDIGESNRQKVYEVLYKVTGVPTHKIWEKFYKNYIADKQIVELIKKIKKDYKIILFSNFVGEILRELLEKDNIAKLFDEIIISSEHKMQKPNTDFFNILIEKSGVEKYEILFIDDRIINIEGAQRMGINAIQFKGVKDLIKEMQKFDVKP
ncbi:MAG: HAD-IA family hydrolase [Patescibacteria group bacterium]